MTKKEYTKPEAKSRRIELGVFGDYSNDTGSGNAKPLPGPVEILRRMNLHME